MDLSFNNLAEFPNVTAALEGRRLTKLLVSNNNIVGVPYTIARLLSSLQLFSMQGNPSICYLAADLTAHLTVLDCDCATVRQIGFLVSPSRPSRHNAHELFSPGRVIDHRLFVLRFRSRSLRLFNFFFLSFTHGSCFA